MIAYPDAHFFFAHPHHILTEQDFVASLPVSRQRFERLCGPLCTVLIGRDNDTAPARFYTPKRNSADLKIRPIYHRLADRIEAHICISFVAYSIYKELERVLKKEKSTMSLVEATEQTQNMYQLNVTLPDSKRKKNILLKMTEKQIELMKSLVII